jgi:tetratricopeptide (TPR) repeat protein
MPNRNWIVACLLAGAVSLLATVARADEGDDKSPDSRMGAAGNLIRGNKHDEALKALSEVLADKGLTDAQRQRAHGLVISSYMQQKNYDKAIQAAKAMAADLRAVPAAQTEAALQQAEALKAQNKKDDAIALLEGFAKSSGDNKAGAAAAWLKVSQFQNGDKKENQEAAQASAVKAVEAAEGNVELLNQCLWQLMDLSGRLGQHEKAEAAIRRMLAPPLIDAREPGSRRDLQRRLIGSLSEQKKFAEVAAAYDAIRKGESDDGERQRWCISAGDSLKEQKLYDQAIAEWEKCFTVYGSVANEWRNAQRRIADVHAAKGDIAEALKAARPYFQTARESDSFNEALRFICELLRRQDGDDPARANAMLAFQQYGPAGPDGKTGTDDDLKDPLAEVGYQSLPRREQALESFRRSAGDTAAACRYRAMSYIYTGRPDEALKHFMDAFARCPFGQLQSCGEDMVVIGLRAVKGTAAVVDEACKYVSFGPAGPDGKSGTADDLADPFGGYAPAKAGQGGPADLSAEDVAALAAVKPMLREIAFDGREDGGLRREAIEALIRVHEALADWDPKADAEMYTQELFHNGGGYWDQLASLAISSARGGQCHLGGVQRWWAALPQSGKDDGQGRVVKELTSRQPFSNIPKGLINPRKLDPGRTKPYAPPKSPPAKKSAGKS